MELTYCDSTTLPFSNEREILCENEFRYDSLTRSMVYWITCFLHSITLYQSGVYFTLMYFLITWNIVLIPTDPTTQMYEIFVNTYQFISVDAIFLCFIPWLHILSKSCYQHDTPQHIQISCFYVQYVHDNLTSTFLSLLSHAIFSDTFSACGPQVGFAQGILSQLW